MLTAYAYHEERSYIPGFEFQKYVKNLTEEPSQICLGPYFDFVSLLAQSSYIVSALPNPS